MPIIEMHLMEGRSAEQKEKMAQAVTNALENECDVNPNSIRILMTEHKNEEFYVAGKRIPLSSEQLAVLSKTANGDRS